MVQMSIFKMKIVILNSIDDELLFEDELECVGSGGFGDIYVCEFLKQTYAIKKIKCEFY
jgi:hypothetical protein